MEYHGLFAGLGGGGIAGLKCNFPDFSYMKLKVGMCLLGTRSLYYYLSIAFLGKQTPALF